MGYSGRYHAASLVAVFIALAIGILIGVGLADDVVSTASQELEESLRSNLDEAEQRAEELAVDVERQSAFADRAYPALVDGRLAGRRVAVIGGGGLDDGIAEDVDAALEPTDAEVRAIAVLVDEIDPDQLKSAAGRRFSELREAADFGALGARLGGQLRSGGALVDRLGPVVFSRSSGSFSGVDSIVFSAAPSPEAGDEETNGTATGQQRAESARAFREGLVTGAARSMRSAVGVTRTDVDSSGLDLYREAGISTVDHLDLTAGRVALVFALGGASGSFGVGDGADELLPDLLETRSRP